MCKPVDPRYGGAMATGRGSVSLPNTTSDEQFKRLDTELDYRPVLAELARRHELGEGEIQRYPDGSVPVFRVGPRWAVKLYPPHDAEHAAVEGEVLARVEGQLGIPTPAVRAAGTVSGWPYLVMSHLAGRPLRTVADEIPAADQIRLAAELGHSIRLLHALAIDAPAEAAAQWSSFMTRQRTGCADRQRERGLASDWADRIEPFLSAIDLGAEQPSRLAWLHTEIMREHVLVEQSDGSWRLSGLIDFEPAMIGHPEYELASVGVFFAEGRPELLSAFLDGLGTPAHARGPELRRRCLAYTLLHRYSCLSWYLQRLPARGPRRNLDDLADEWWAT